MGDRDLGLDELRHRRYAAEERTAARTLSAIANSSVVGCRPLSEKHRLICAVTAMSWAWAASTWSWAASIRAKATAAEQTADVPFSPVATPEVDVATAT